MVPREGEYEYKKEDLKPQVDLLEPLEIGKLNNLI